MQEHQYWWYRQTMAETFQRIRGEPQYPWNAIGDFLDEWRRSPLDDRLPLIQEGLSWQEASEVFQWAVLCAALVDYLCQQEHLTPPLWVQEPLLTLPNPWYLYPGRQLRQWQETQTPEPFTRRNIFGGDRIALRV